MSLSIPRHLLLLSFLLLSSTLPPSSSQWEDRKCFVCSSETSSKCEGGLSSSDTELIEQCSRGVNNRVKSSGCQIFILQTGYYEYPRKRIVMRDCLYPSDIRHHYDWETPPSKDEPWYRGSKYSDNTMVESGINDHRYSKVEDVNDDRKRWRLPSMPLKTYFYRSEDTWRYFIHPLTDNWNVSNGKSEESPGFYRNRTMRSVKCFVCTHEDPGCEDSLTPSNTSFIKDCVGSGDTTVPIGCTIHAAVYKYPHKYFYRDCLYENYLRCHRRKSKLDSDETWYNFPSTIQCLNHVRKYLGLTPHSRTSKDHGSFNSKPTTILYFVRGQESPYNLWDHIEVHSTQPNMSNGIRMADVLKKQPDYPPDLNPGPFSCHSCDTQTRRCGGNKGEVIRRLPREECKPPHDEAFGCMTLYSVNHSPNPYINSTTRYMRRGCWFKGDLFCLKRLKMPSWRSESGGPCPPGDCNARELLARGRTVKWYGERALYRYSYEEIRNCLRDVRQRHGVNESLPELPEFEDVKPKPLDGKGTGLKFEFCAGRTLRNDQETYNIKHQTPIPPSTTTTTTTSTTTTTTTTTSSTTPPPTTTKGGGTCDPDDEVDYDCVCEGDCSDSKAWIFGMLVGIVALAFIIGVGIWLFLKKTGRLARGHPEPGGNLAASSTPMQQGQANGSEPVTNSQPAEQGLRHSTDSSGSITEDADSEQSVGT